jgi:hypothetical protein
MKLNPALALIAIYIVVTSILQFIGFLLAESAEAFDPGVGLMVFLALFLGMFWLAWPIAVRVAEAYVPGAKPAP